MGKTTDQLIEMAYQVSPQPNRSELDMLLTTGERISMSLMSMALADLGVPAISFTGSQADVMTDASHSGPRILDVRPVRVREELDRGRIVVLAGFRASIQRPGKSPRLAAAAATISARRDQINSRSPPMAEALTLDHVADAMKGIDIAIMSTHAEQSDREPTEWRRSSRRYFLLLFLRWSLVRRGHRPRSQRGPASNGGMFSGAICLTVEGTRGDHQAQGGFPAERYRAERPLGAIA
jgi:hypothetical protein